MKQVLIAVVSKEEVKIIPYLYIYIKEDGSIRELYEDEKEYLETAYHPADGDRPYIKENAMQRTINGNLAGFCKRDINKESNHE